MANGAGNGSSGRGPTPPTLHGRDPQLTALVDAVDQAIAGRGSPVLVTGEPGIGKTFLTEHAARHAREQGAQVVVTRCPSDEGAPPYWPWSEVLAQCTDQAEGLRLDRPVEQPRDQPPAAPEDDTARFELFTRVARALHEAAEERPLLIVLDDLQWADTPTLRLFEFLAGTVQSVPLLLVGTYRDVEIESQHLLAAVAARLPGDTVRLELRPLGAGHLARLVADVVGAVPSRELVKYVHRHTGGNPLFAREVVRLLAAEERIAVPPRDLVLPNGVRGVIERRLEIFPPDLVDILRWAALCGDEFASDLVEQTSPAAPGDVHRAISGARHNRLVEPLPERPGSYRFTHGLVAETLREGLDDTDSRLRHLQLGQALVHRESGTQLPLAAISRHLLAAFPEGDAEVTVDYTVRAARYAAQALAWEEATRLYGRALHVLDAMTGTATRLAEIRIERAAVVARTADGPESRQAAHEAVEAARSTGQPVLLARAALTLSARTFADAGNAATIDLLEEALAGIATDDSTLRAELLARLSEELSHLDRARSRRLADDALAMAVRLGQASAIWEALIQKHRARRGSVDLDERLATSGELVKLGKELDDVERTLLGRIRLVVDLVTAGRRADLDRELVSFARTVDRARLHSFRWFVPLWSGTRALAEGRLAQAQQLADEVGRLAVPRGEYAMAQFAIQLTGIRLQQDKLADVEGMIAAAAHLSPTIPVYRCALAFIHTEMGRAASAHAILEPLAVDGFAAVPEDQEWTTAAYCLTESCVSLRRVDWAHALYERLLPYARHQVVIGSGAVYLGSVDQSLGRLAGLLDQPDLATHHFQGALAAVEEFGASLWAAQVKHDWAAVLLAHPGSGHYQLAHDLLRAADLFADEMDIPRLRRQIDNTRSGDATAATPTAARNIFRQDGEHWTIRYRGKGTRLRDRKGMHDIAALLAEPGQAIHVFELLAASGQPRLDQGADPALDTVAYGKLRQHLADLHDELDEAERFADTGRANQARHEIEVITTHLTTSLGLSGRARHPGDPVERARKTVWRRIRTSIDRIDSELPTLALHLERSLHTGTFCRYSPEEPIDWSLF